MKHLVFVLILTTQALCQLQKLSEFETFEKYTEFPNKKISIADIGKYTRVSNEGSYALTSLRKSKFEGEEITEKFIMYKIDKSTTPPSVKEQKEIQSPISGKTKVLHTEFLSDKMLLIFAGVTGSSDLDVGCYEIQDDMTLKEIAFDKSKLPQINAYMYSTGRDTVLYSSGYDISVFQTDGTAVTLKKWTWVPSSYHSISHSSLNDFNEMKTKVYEYFSKWQGGTTVVENKILVVDYSKVSNSIVEIVNPITPVHGSVYLSSWNSLNPDFGLIYYRTFQAQKSDILYLDFTESTPNFIGSLVDNEFEVKSLLNIFDTEYFLLVTSTATGFKSHLTYTGNLKKGDIEGKIILVDVTEEILSKHQNLAQGGYIGYMANYGYKTNSIILDYWSSDDPNQTSARLWNHPLAIEVKLAPCEFFLNTPTIDCTGNSKYISGCVQCSESDPGLCKSTVKGFGLDKYTSDFKSGKCVVRCTEGCMFCEMKEGDEKRSCQECFEGYSLVDGIGEYEGVKVCSFKKLITNLFLMYSPFYFFF